MGRRNPYVTTALICSGDRSSIRSCALSWWKWMGSKASWQAPAWSWNHFLKAVRAIEMHMAQSCIAMGILQSISVSSLGKLSSNQLRYQRTPSKGRVSEAALMAHLRKYFFLFMEKQPELRITRIIRKQQDSSGSYCDSQAS